MIGRRGFLAGLAGILAAGMAPAIVKQPMKIYVPPKKIITPLAGLGADFDGDTRGLLWRPELTLVVPLPRDGVSVKKLVTQPLFKQVTNLPIMGVLSVADQKIRRVRPNSVAQPPSSFDWLLEEPSYR